MILESLQAQQDKLREWLGEIYEREFPTVEQTTEENQGPVKGHAMDDVKDGRAEKSPGAANQSQSAERRR
jgi:hypothetical protein